MAYRTEKLLLLWAWLAVFASFRPLPGLAQDGSVVGKGRFLSATGTPLDENYRADPQSVTYFVIHGFQASGQSPSIVRQAMAIQHRTPGSNVVIVDWSTAVSPVRTACDASDNPLSQLLLGGVRLWTLYQTAVAGADEIAAHIVAWMKVHKIVPRRTVLCGHSLGAQIAGLVGKQCSAKDGFAEPIHAILAADPAGPAFAHRTIAGRLDRTDAESVIVIHGSRYLADVSAIGTVDMYVAWPQSVELNELLRHSEPHELLTQSFLDVRMANDDGSPFGANAIGFDFGDCRITTLSWMAATHRP